MNNSQYYNQELVRPYWAPPSSVFGPVWTFLYIIIIVSFGSVFLRTFKGEVPFVIALPFILNLIFNLVYTPIQFGLKNNYLASLDIVLVLGTLVWALIAIWPYMKWVSFANIPYLLWVCFATVLQLTITWLNR